jgi:hypothetical protein
MRERIVALSKFESRLLPLITEFNCLTRLMAIRLSRYLMLIVLSGRFEAFDRTPVIRLLSLLILELAPFVRSVSIAAKWTQVFGTDFVFSRDVSRLRRKLRALLLSIYKTPSSRTWRRICLRRPHHR